MDADQKHALLRLARETIRAHLAGEPLPSLPACNVQSPVGGVFVTLRNAGRLRGCIGQFRTEPDLSVAIQRTAVSVLSDPRFTRSPVTLAEVPALTISISVLSAMELCPDPLSLVPGVHGILVRRGSRSGCFLPEVAVEMGWDAGEFLSRCCGDKAGLPPDAWKDPATQVCLFTSIHFDETATCPAH